MKFGPNHIDHPKILNFIYYFILYLWAINPMISTPVKLFYPKKIKILLIQYNSVGPKQGYFIFSSSLNFYEWALLTGTQFVESGCTVPGGLFSKRVTHDGPTQL